MTVQRSLFGAPERALSEWAAPDHQEAAAAAAAKLRLFLNPAANSRIELKGYGVAYVLQRARRRSIGLSVNGEGLSVSAPYGSTLNDIQSALITKADWIIRKLCDQHDRAQRIQCAQAHWMAGRLPFLGQTLHVQRTLHSGCSFDAPSSVLSVGLGSTAGAPQMQAAVLAWLKSQAMQTFVQRCEHFAPLLRVQPRKVMLSSAQTRWGSAHTSGVIRLNWRLIHFDLHIIDYVVAHELAHLREMNHSPRFWALVASVVPSVSLAQQVLKDTVLPVLRG